ncbi:hypothetical protein ACTRXD_00415 [Nitrospira sp. T9]|uniref:hypothetical protein n=1 Tax=unclassified Nitrospira TaxID=2652172 RepID=UPI003F9B0D89
MGTDKGFTWEQGPSKDDVILRTREGEDIAYIFPRDNKEGFTLLTKNHGEFWSEKGQHCDSLLAAKHHAIQHVERYYLQEKYNLEEAHRHSVLHDLQKEWQRMGGDPRTIREFKAEWDRVSAAHHKTKIPDREDRDQGHER